RWARTPRLVAQARPLVQNWHGRLIGHAPHYALEARVQHEGRQLAEIPVRVGGRDGHDLDARVERGNVVGRDQNRGAGEVFEVVQDAGGVPDGSAGANPEAQVGSQVERRRRQVDVRYRARL